MIAQAVLWYLIITLGGVAAAGALQRWGAGSSAAWAVARVVGWTAAGYLAFLAGWLGYSRWWWLALVGLVALGVWGARDLLRTNWRTLADVELVGIGAFALLTLLRLPLLPIQGTEKPMDLAILATLLRPGTLPPADPWLAGQSLPYYYWGFVPWLAPGKLLGLAPDVLYNLLVPTLAAVTAQAAWALARALGGSRRSGALAAFLVVFSGTPDGVRQLLTGTRLVDLDLWHSSRQIAGTITEFPLFTFHLGDLHPHLLCLPMLLVAMFLARGVVRDARSRGIPLVLLALVYGAAAAANPWCALPGGLAIALLLAAREDGFVWPSGPGWKVWLRAAFVGVLGYALFLPFWLNFHPPTSGIGLVRVPTRIDEFVLLLGAAVLAPMLAALEIARRWGGHDGARRSLALAMWIAAIAVFAGLTRAFAFAVALGVLAAFGFVALRGKFRQGRSLFALMLVPFLLLAFVELVYLRDPYGDEFYRMNTVFKGVHIAFTLLAVGTPVLLGWLRRRRPALAIGAAVLVLAAGAPQLGALLVRSFGHEFRTWSGLSWMAPGEAEASAWLRGTPPGTVVVEGLGDAYSDAARMSATSGVPAALGWENHEGVWRGAVGSGRVSEARKKIEQLYRCGDVEEVRRLAGELRANIIVVGSIERQQYPKAGLDAVRKAGPVAFSAGGVALVRVRD